jgi:hypothetical protein
MKFFRREQRKPVAQIEPHLIAKNAQRPCSGAIGSANPAVEDMLEKIKVLAHRHGGRKLRGSASR